MTATTVTLVLPRALEGAKLRVYRQAGDEAYKRVATTTSRSVKVGFGLLPDADRRPRTGAPDKRACEAG